jgi:hypothetical protein
LTAFDGRPVDGVYLYRMPTEKALFKGFLNVMDFFDPDIIIGWHVIGFDLFFLEKKYRDYRMPFSIGRDQGPPRIQEVRKGLFRADICGRVVIDGPPALRAAFYSFDNFRLETVASALLGAGKDIGKEKDKVAEIERRFREDKRGLARYNLLDCKLVSDIFEKTGLIDLVYKREQAKRDNDPHALSGPVPLDQASVQGRCRPPFGKHGSLEWLPGKVVGLSSRCYPDQAVMNLPNTYIYIINDPGEGSQAKRRSAACIVDHLPPTFTNADIYDDFVEVDQLD